MLSNSNGIKIFSDKNKILAILLRPDEIAGERVFVTPEEFPMQVGVHTRKKGSAIPPHVHIPFENLKNLDVQEMFYVMTGKVKVTLYNEGKIFETVMLGQGDLFIMNCGHGIEFSEDSKFFEIKQGPYRGMTGEKRLLG